MTPAPPPPRPVVALLERAARCRASLSALLMSGPIARADPGAREAAALAADDATALRALAAAVAGVLPVTYAETVADSEARAIQTADIDPDYARSEQALAALLRLLAAPDDADAGRRGMAGEESR